MSIEKDDIVEEPKPAIEPGVVEHRLEIIRQQLEAYDNAIAELTESLNSNTRELEKALHLLRRLEDRQNEPTP